MWYHSAVVQRVWVSFGRIYLSMHLPVFIFHVALCRNTFNSLSATSFTSDRQSKFCKVQPAIWRRNHSVFGLVLIPYASALTWRRLYSIWRLLSKLTTHFLNSQLKHHPQLSPTSCCISCPSRYPPKNRCQFNIDILLQLFV